MSIDAKHFYDLVITPALFKLGKARSTLDSIVARKLVLATFCHESAAGTFLRQVNNQGNYSVARGVFQVEPPTHEWIWNWLSQDRNSDIRDIVVAELAQGSCYPHHEQLITNLTYSAMMCRLRYFLVPAALPDKGSLFSLANYWGKYYQTGDKDLNSLGSKEKTFIDHCKRYAPEFF